MGRRLILLSLPGSQSSFSLPWPSGPNGAHDENDTRRLIARRGYAAAVRHNDVSA
jgi:hypothetical protein